MLKSKADVVEKVLAAIEGGYLREAGAHLADDFAFVGPMPRPVNKEEFLEMHQRLIDAIPDWKYNETDVREQGDAVSFKVHITGTNLGRLTLRLVGVFDEPATGKRVALPEEPATATFRGDRILTLQARQVPNGGISGILRQLGIPSPALASV